MRYLRLTRVDGKGNLKAGSRLIKVADHLVLMPWDPEGQTPPFATPRRQEHAPGEHCNCLGKGVHGLMNRSYDLSLGQGPKWRGLPRAWQLCAHARFRGGEQNAKHRRYPGDTRAPECGK